MAHDLDGALRGISGILVTPYDGQDAIAPERLAPIIDRALGAGVHMPVVNGNTGEFYALTTDEACTMVREVTSMVAGRAPVLAGVGRGIRDACRLAETSAEAGASALMIHQPPDPFVAPRGIVDYVKEVSRAADGLPIMLYLRNDAIGIDGIRALCDLPGVKGVKWATPSPMNLSAAIAACDPSIVWVGGLAEVWAPTFYAVGARGFTSGLINIWPERSMEILAALDAQDYDRARTLIDGMRPFEDIRAEELNGTNVTGVKAALRATGHDCGPSRPPSAWPLTHEQDRRLHAFLDTNDLVRKEPTTMRDKTYQTHGKHLIGGDWIGGAATFSSEPVRGSAQDFSVGTPDLVDQAVAAAEGAFSAYASTSREDRASFLEAIASEMEARVDAITDVATAETGLPEPRIRAVELPRTANQLRLFAGHIRDGAYLDRRHDAAMPEREPMPRPDLRMIQRPIGPVAVFGASNFPLAFSTAGGDTASALAAGCPVVVKGHGAHPGTSEIVAEAIRAAIASTGMPAGVFSLVQGGDRKVGQTLVQHPLIKAVGFTGSLKGGRALYDLCAAREEPIPFYGELGSVNPMFMLPGVMGEKATELGKSWAGSLTMGAGQFCTNPGVAVVRDGPEADAFRDAARAALEEMGPQTMLTDGIASAYKHGAEALRGEPGVIEVVASSPGAREGTPFLFETDGNTWFKNERLREEVFGPAGLIVRVSSEDEMRRLAGELEGQLTCTLHLNDADAELGRTLLPILERKAGRILANGFPTGVEVADAMVHGGPYPASTNFGATSVGTLAIRRFLRPVCFQNIPEAILPEDVR